MSDILRTEVEESAKLSLAHQVDLVCDAFEEAWARGETPRIEDFLNRCDAADRPSLFAELLLVDREFRVKRGESVTRTSYRERFPDYARFIDEVEFATIDDRARAGASTIRDWNIRSPGGRIAHFELLEELGTGASGTVWKARDTKLRRVVAVKMPRQLGLSGPERERFLREGQAAAQLRHPNIVTVFEVGEDHHQAFIVAEFVDGVDLRSWLSHRRPMFRQTAEVAAQIAEALHHAHEQGIIHRDLKPANVLMDNEGRPHITDFGLAKWTADTARMTVEGNILGTPAYMPPEQARGNIDQVDRRSDVYGLGALLYEMLTGRPPFEGDVATIVHQVIHQDPRPPNKIVRGVPRDLETICLKAMAKEPSGRYPSAQEMAVDLRRYARGEPILARRAGSLERSWRWTRRHPAIAAAIVVVAVAVTAASAMIHSLNEQNYRLQGYRPVLVTSNPSGARVAFVPVDSRTGEPDPDPAGIRQLTGVTPCKALLKPGKYLIEAVVGAGGESAYFAEEYRTIPEKSLTPEKIRRENANLGYEEDQFSFCITIKKRQDVIDKMVAVPIAKELRRKNPLLPRLLYIDAEEDQRELSLVAAMDYFLGTGKRLPSAAEYDAIVRSLKDPETGFFQDRRGAKLDDLLSGRAEWTTTKFRYGGNGNTNTLLEMQNMQVLKGYGDPTQLSGIHRCIDGTLIAPPDTASPLIGFRGVRSGTPRFVKP